MSFAENLRETAENKSKIEKNVQKAVNQFKKVAERAAGKGYTETTVFLCSPSGSDRKMADDIAHQCISILEGDLGFSTRVGYPFEAPDSLSKEIYQVIPITLYW